MSISISKPIIGEQEEEAVANVLRSGFLAQGKITEEFEKEFASYIGTKEAIAVANGTVALFLTLVALGLKKGDEVITTPFSFVASSSAILMVGAKPIFADINEDDFNINPESIEKKITKNTKALLIVHLFGNPCEMAKIKDLVKRHHLILIEDACQAHGASYKGKKVGSFGIGCFSFYATKNMTTGEGGMVTTNSLGLARKIRMLRNHGSKVRYFHDFLGYNMRITDIQSAIGREQLKKLDFFNQKRIENAKYVSNALKSVKGVKVPVVSQNKVQVFHQYTIIINKEFPVSRDFVIKTFSEKQIGYGVYYPVPINKQKIFKVLKYPSSETPISNRISKQVISLPIHPSLSRADLDMIIGVILGLAK